MNFRNSTAELFIPDGTAESTALGRITHLGIGAHQDDLEFMAFHGIVACFHNAEQWFGGVTCTNGAGSPRVGPYAGCSDAGMQQIRRQEQNLAAQLGRYGAMVQLDHASAAVKDPGGKPLLDDLIAVLEATRPRIVYTHNPADKHDTHVAVTAATIAALRALPQDCRPEKVYGCEVWRDLDWLPDDAKILLDVGGHDSLAAALNGVFDSQITGGKRYDLGVIGRRRANATFFESHSVDRAEGVTFAMDLTPLLADGALGLEDYVELLLGRFCDDVRAKLRVQSGR